MKAIKFMSTLLVAAAMSLGVTACGDEDLKDLIDDALDKIDFGKAKVTLTESTTTNGAKITLDVDYIVYTMNEVGEFVKEGENLVCTKLEAKYKLPSEKMAKELYEELKEEATQEWINQKGEEHGITLDDKLDKIVVNGKNISVDLLDAGEEYKDNFTYEAVLGAMTVQAQALKKSGATVTINGKKQ